MKDNRSAVKSMLPHGYKHASRGERCRLKGKDLGSSIARIAEVLDDIRKILDSVIGKTDAKRMFVRTFDVSWNS